MFHPFKSELEFMNILSSLFSSKNTKGEHTKFVILFFERSGSSWLVDMLNNHPEVSCLHEVFSLKWEGEDKEKKGKPIYTTEAQIKKQLHKIYEKPNAKARGFKFKYPIQYNHYPHIVDFLNENKNDIRTIFLYRKNKLKGAISSQNNARLRALNRRSNLTVNEKGLPPLELNTEEAIKYTEWRERSDFNFFKWAKEFSHLHVITYEDLLNDTVSTLKGVCDFLNVSPTHAPTSKVRKSTPDSIQQAITNYDELREQLRCHPLEKYLDF